MGQDRCPPLASHPRARFVAKSDKAPTPVLFVFAAAREPLVALRHVPRYQELSEPAPWLEWHASHRADLNPAQRHEGQIATENPFLYGSELARRKSKVSASAEL
jgi:hypothetical protein